MDAVVVIARGVTESTAPAAALALSARAVSASSAAGASASARGSSATALESWSNSSLTCCLPRTSQARPLASPLGSAGSVARTAHAATPFTLRSAQNMCPFCSQREISLSFSLSASPRRSAHCSPPTYLRTRTTMALARSVRAARCVRVPSSRTIRLSSWSKSVERTEASAEMRREISIGFLECHRLSR